MVSAERVLAPSDEDIEDFVNDLKARSGGDIHLSNGVVGLYYQPRGG